MFKKFESQGYDVFQADDLSVLRELREGIFERAKTLVPYKGEDCESFFNNFHQYGVTGSELNKVRLDLVNYSTKELRLNQTILHAFDKKLTALLGPDIAGQKTVNFVIHQPGDADQVPTHRDAPTNSNFEIVVWLPLGDVYKTKSMFVSDRKQSQNALKLLQDGRSYSEFCDYVQAHSIDLEAPFGSACFFAAGLAHGCKINRENETRWSLNVRYKNLFSPYALKGLIDFFEILKLSPMSKIAFSFERQEYA